MKKLFTPLIILLLFPVLLRAQVVQKANLPSTGRDAAISFSIGNKVYMGGGLGAIDFFEFDPAQNKWTKKANIPGVKTQRAFGMGFAIGNKGYVGLGADSNSNLIKKDLWEYDPATDKWTQKADFPSFARDGITYFTVGSKAYILGGTDNKLVYGDMYEYDATNNTWQQLNTSYPPGVIIFGSGFSIGNYGYVTCGAGASEYTETYRFDPSTLTWDQMADFPGAARQTTAAFVIGNMAYVGSGQQGYQTVYKDFYRYNPANNTWAPVGDIGNKGRAWAIATSANGKGYVGTGWDFATTFFNDWWEFTPQNITGIDDVAAGSSFSVYPNPVSSYLTIEIKEGNGSYNITDMLGRTILAGNIETAATTIDVSNLDAGIYTIQVEAAGIISSRKISVVR